MPTYAVLGATGKTGQSLVQILLQKPGAQIHAYCRSKQKLLKQFPGIDQNKDVQIFQGNVNDVELMAKCLEDTRAAFHVVAASENDPDCSICMAASKNIVSAVQTLQANKGTLPRLIVLSSSSTEHRFVSQVPAFLEAILYRAFSYIYDDLKQAEAFLRSQSSVVTTTFVKPSALSKDIRKGHSIDFDNSRGPMSFLDLAAGMVEIADDDNGKYDMKSVTVNPTAKDVAFPKDAPGLIFRGLIFHFFPWTFRLFGY